MSCPCECCGAQYEDFPDVIYANMTITLGGVPTEYYTRMYKQVTGGTYKACGCGTQCGSNLTYWSLLGLIGDISADFTCCVHFGLSARCVPESQERCLWIAYFLDSEPGGDYRETTEAAWDCMVDGTASWSLPRSDCYNGIGTVSVIYSESPVGVPLQPCDKTCDDDAAVLYVTLESDCPALNGKTVTVYRDNCTGNSTIGLYNRGGEMQSTWGGFLKPGCIDPTCFSTAPGLPVYVGSSTWSDPAGDDPGPRCYWGVRFGAACATRTNFSYTAGYPLPVTFEDLVWSTGGLFCNCCTDLAPFTVTATVSR